MSADGPQLDFADALADARMASRRAYTFFAVLWVSVVLLMGIGLVALYNSAAHTNRVLACVLSVSPEDRGDDLWMECDGRVP